MIAPNFALTLVAGISLSGPVIAGDTDLNLGFRLSARSSFERLLLFYYCWKISWLGNEPLQ